MSPGPIADSKLVGFKIVLHSRACGANYVRIAFDIRLKLTHRRRRPCSVIVPFSAHLILTVLVASISGKTIFEYSR